MQDLLETFRSLLLCSIRGGSELVDLTSEELTELQAVAATTTTETLHLQLSLLMDAAEKMQYAPQPRLALEIALLKIIETGNITPLATLLGQMDSLLPQLQESAQHRTPPEPATAQTPAEKAVPAAPIIAEPPPALAPPAPTEKPAGEPQGKRTEPEKKTVETEETPDSPIAAEPTAATDNTLQRRWADFLQFLEKDTVWLAAAAANAEEQRFITEGITTTLHLHFAERKDMVLLAQPENLQQLTSLALDFFKKELTIELHHPDNTDEADENSPRMRRKTLARNPLVQMTEEIFRGSVSAVRLTNQRKPGE